MNYSSCLADIDQLGLESDLVNSRVRGGLVLQGSGDVYERSEPMAILSIMIRN